MSKNLPPVLNIEWSPSWVRAVDTVTGQMAEGTKLSDLSPVISGKREAVVGVGRSSVFLKTLRLPKGSRDDLRRILSVQIGQLFPLPSDQLSFDFFQTTDITAEGCLTLVAAMRADELKQLLFELKQAGIAPTRILPVALGAPAVSASAGARDALVAECTAAGLALDIVQGGILRLSRVAPRDADPTVEARRTLAAARVDSAALVAAGEVPLPEALPGFGTPLSKLQEASPFNFELEEDRTRVEKKRQGEHMRMAGLLMAAALCILLYVVVTHLDAANAMRASNATWTRQLTKLQKQKDDATNSASVIMNAQEAVSKALQPAQPLSDIASAISDSLPPGAWLTAVDVERGKAVQIRGAAKSADDVTTFISNLGSNPRFRNVRLVFANAGTIGKATVQQFNVSAVAVGNLPMPALAKTTGAAPKSGQPVMINVTGIQQ